MIAELVRAFLFIFIAEMGDKTQILALTFATRYKVREVIVGVLIGSAVNHGIAIALGAYLSNTIPTNAIQIVAGALFVLFGLWTLKKEEDDDEEETKNSYGPVLTVAIAFFIGELGDKTQLTAMTLATDAQFPVFILMGTVLGMIATSGIGILVGSKVGEKIPDLAIKVISAGVFIFFGTLKLFNTVPQQYITVTSVIGYLIILGTIVSILVWSSVKHDRIIRKSPLKEAAATLYLQTNKIRKAVDNICLGENRCGGCEGKGCLVGFTKESLSLAAEQGNYILDMKSKKMPNLTQKSFNKYKAAEALSMVIAHYMTYGIDGDKNHAINKAREALEIIAFGVHIPFNNDVNKYIEQLSIYDKSLSDIITKKVQEIEEK